MGRFSNPTLLVIALMLVICNACQNDLHKQSNKLPEQAVVTDIVKGDEIVIQYNKKTIGLRLIGIQAFSHTTSKDEIVTMAQKSKDFLKQHILNKTVTLHYDHPTHDVYKRLLAYISIDNKDINKLLLQEGYAITYTEFPFTREMEYLAVETQARMKKLKLWDSDTLTKAAIGLRRQWSQIRKTNSKRPLQDPLLNNQ